MKKLIFITMICMSSFAFAEQSTPTTSALEISKEEAAKTPEGILPFIAAGGGYTGYENVNSVEGTPATLKLLGSWYFTSPYVVDLGYGVNNQQFSQAGNNQETAETGGALEFAARYRWENRWQAGIVANQLYEQGKFYSADQGDAHFVGLQALREFNISPSWLGRVGVRAMSLTNNTDGLVPMYLIDLQIGWNPGAYKPSVRQTAATENPVKRETVAPARPIAAVEPEPVLREVAYTNLVAGGGNFNFNSSRVALSNQDQQRLSKIAKALADNKDLFERVEIHGYSDATGSSAVNERLSQQRANQVRSIMRKNGLSASEVVAKGMGTGSSTGAMVSDRRAELIFVGVKDEEKLRNVLSNIE